MKIPYIYCLVSLVTAYCSYAMKEKPVTIAALGPAGTFSEQAAQLLAHEMYGENNYKIVLEKSITETIENMVSNKYSHAVVPVENSIGGAVITTNDALWQNNNIRILRSMVIPIQHALLCSSNQKLEAIFKVLSHPQALKQCKDWLKKYCPQATQEETESTADAAQKVLGNPTWAAVASESAAQNGLVKRAFPINDIPNNGTKFILLTNTDGTEYIPEHISHTSIALLLKNTKCGALKHVIDLMYEHKLNMSKLESRQDGTGTADYVFYIDIESDDTPSIKSVLQQLKPLCARFVNYGSYLTTHVSGTTETVTADSEAYIDTHEEVKKHKHNNNVNYTSLALLLRNTKCGSLKKVVDILYEHQLNMCKIDSKPTKIGLGTYVFYIDLETTKGSRINSAIQYIRPLCDRLVNYGSLNTYIV